MIHTALNTLKNLSANRDVRAQNMSNLNVPGHRKDLNTNLRDWFDTARASLRSMIKDGLLACGKILS